MTGLLRTLPFATFAIASLIWAARAPDGRKPFTFAWDVSSDAVLLALTKWPHMASMALLYVLALIATGVRRPLLAAALVFATGIGWEVAQTTVVGHNARIADLAPNAVSLAVCVLVTWAIRAVYQSRRGA